jgi:trehalose 6-phosphate phosphatase
MEAKLDPALSQWAAPLREFALAEDTAAMRRARIRIEDKGVIFAFHWRGAGDEGTARALLEALAARARKAGFEVHWGRKVLEVRPPVRIDKGEGVTSLIRQADVKTAMYVGDDVTDLDAFRAITELTETGDLQYGLRVGVRSEDGPAELAAAADLLVDGTEGVRSLLASLVAD